MAIDELKACRILIRGHVQGVGYRYFAQKHASNNNIKGWVRNLSGGDLEIHAEGSRQDLSAFTSKLLQGPPSSDVKDMETENLVNLERYSSFEIRY